MGWHTNGTPPASPAWYPTLTHKQRAGLYYAGQTIGATLNASGATSYVAKDALTGATVASGAISGTDVTIGTAGTAPFDKYGCWHIELTGPNNDASAALYGTSYGGFFASFIPTDARFPTNPDAGSYTQAPLGGFVHGDTATRGVLGIGPERLSIDNAADPTAGTANAVANIANAGTAAASEQTWHVGYAPDSVRPRASFCAFPNNGFDRLKVFDTDAVTVLGSFYPAEPITYNGDNLYVQIDTGTSSGVKVTIRYPDSATVVETYDNLANMNAIVSATATSTHVRVGTSRGSFTPPTKTATAIGGAYGRGVTATVTALYPNVSYYEGPRNEAGEGGAELAAMMRGFTKTVKAGNAAAKVIGPSLVEYLAPHIGTMTAFFAAGGGTWIDAPSTHGYNCANLGDVALARSTLSAWRAVLTANGFTSWWQTECEINTSNYGALHTRRGVNWQWVMTLMNEQYGCPKEQTHFWYDISHGFWAAPGQWETTDGSVYPSAVSYRAFSAEVYGKAYTAALSFGQPGDDYLIGNVYTNPTSGDKVVALLGAGVGTGIPVTFTVTGASSLTVVDWMSNVTTIPASGGTVTVTVTDTPTILRVPAGVNIALLSHSTFGPAAPTNLATTATVTSTGSSTNLSRINDGVATNGYGGSTAPYTDTTGSLPGQITLTWATPQRLDHVVVKCPPPWQALSTFLDFDVQSSTDGTTWATQRTITKDLTALVYQHAENGNQAGTLITSYWDEQHTFDVKFSAPVTAKAVRLNVRATSYGGEPTVDAVTQSVGQRSATQQMVVADVFAGLDPADPTAPVWLFHAGAFD